MSGCFAEDNSQPLPMTKIRYSFSIGMEHGKTVFHAANIGNWVETGRTPFAMFTFFVYFTHLVATLWSHWHQFFSHAIQANLVARPISPVLLPCQFWIKTIFVYFTTAVPLAVNSRTAFTFLPHSTTTTFFARSFAGSFPRFSDGQRGRRCLLPRLQPHHGHQQHRGLQVVLTWQSLFQENNQWMRVPPTNYYS